jgi:DNA-binding transcriptional ArsR family regulator
MELRGVWLCLPPKTNYSKQKKQAFAYFRVNERDVPALEGRRFTLYDFINNCFAFSPEKKEIAIRVLQALKEEPRSFSRLQSDLGLKKSTLYLLLVALEKSGLVSQGGRGEPVRLSGGFGKVLSAYAEWWHYWSAGNEPQTGVLAEGED